MLFGLNRHKKTALALWVACSLMFVSAEFTTAQTKAVVKKQNATAAVAQVKDDATYNLVVGSERRFQCEFRVPEFEVENPVVIEVNAVSPTELVVVPLKTGVSAIKIYDEERKAHSITIDVQLDTRKLERSLQLLFPDLTIESTRDLVFLKGAVRDLEQKELVVLVAKDYLRRATESDCEVVDEMTIEGVTDTIAYAVKVYEVDSSKLKTLGANATDETKQIVSKISQLMSAEAAPNKISIPTLGKAPPLSFIISTVVESRNIAFVKAAFASLESSGAAKLLAQPTLVAELTGPAEFLSPIQIAIPKNSGAELELDGTKLKMVARDKSTKAGMKLAVQLNVTTQQQQSANHQSGNRARRRDGAIEVTPGETFCFVTKTYSTDGELKETVFLVTPRYSDLPRTASLLGFVPDELANQPEEFRLLDGPNQPTLMR